MVGSGEGSSLRYFSDAAPTILACPTSLRPLGGLGGGGGEKRGGLWPASGSQVDRHTPDGMGGWWAWCGSMTAEGDSRAEGAPPRGAPLPPRWIRCQARPRGPLSTGILMLSSRAVGAQRAHASSALVGSVEHAVDRVDDPIELLVRLDLAVPHRQLRVDELPFGSDLERSLLGASEDCRRDGNLVAELVREEALECGGEAGVPSPAAEVNVHWDAPSAATVRV